MEIVQTAALEKEALEKVPLFASASRCEKHRLFD
jgi:hypothetical protein